MTEYTSRQACAASGASYRQLDYWLRHGYVRHKTPNPGTGHPRLLTADQIMAAGLLTDLTALGVVPDKFGTSALGKLRRYGKVRLGSVVLTYDADAHRKHINARLEGL